MNLHSRWTPTSAHAAQLSAGPSGDWQRARAPASLNKGPYLVTNRTVCDRRWVPGIPGFRLAMGSALGFLPSPSHGVRAGSPLHR
jgi:hypothetical protein